MKSLIILISLFFSTIILTFSMPIAVFHGIGDSCSNSGMQSITSYFGREVGSYSKCIETAGGFFDFLFYSFEEQYKSACKAINADRNFDGDFSVVGLSQGALLARAVIEKCEMKGRVKRYVSIGGPQAGVAKVPQCTGGWICSVINGIADTFIYNYFVQNFIGPAGYFKNANNLYAYQQGSIFLADLNNEKDTKNPDYKARMINLDKVVLIKFAADTMILPGETAWFSFINVNDEVINYKDTELYKQDFIGIKTLDEANKIHFVTLPGNHLRFSYSDIDSVMVPALK